MYDIDRDAGLLGFKQMVSQGITTDWVGGLNVLVFTLFLNYV